MSYNKLEPKLTESAADKNIDIIYVQVHRYYLKKLLKNTVNPIKNGY